jgi:hypothetical protein
MSKGEIISHAGEGKYLVRQKLATDRIQRELEKLGERLAQLAVDLPNKKLELIQADGAVNDKAQDIDSAIPALMAGEEGARDTIKRLQTELIRLRSDASQIGFEVKALIAEDLAARKRKNLLQRVPDGKDLEAWCADFSLELEGEVGIADINDEGGKGLVIRPGFEDLAVHEPDRDGTLYPDLAQSSAQAYLNAALLPGVQKWRPQYRVGIITSVVDDFCDLSMADAKSSAQGLDINKESVLRGVPIKYMDCNGDVFQEGDRVVVEMQGRDWQQPRVIGFESNPRECTPAFLFFGTSSYCSINYNGIPFHARFYKINFSSYDIELHSEVEVDLNTLIPEVGYYVHEREPYRALARNPTCEFSYGEVAEYGIISAVNGFSTFNFTDRGIVSPSKISDTEGVGVSTDLYLPGESPDRRETTLVFFDIDTLNQTGEYSYFQGSAGLLFERVVATEQAIVVQTFRGDSNDFYGLMSFNRELNMMAQHIYGDNLLGGVTGFGSNAEYVFVVIYGDETFLFVHDAQTLAVVHTMQISDGLQTVAATEGHLILCSLKSEGVASLDGRTEIYKISTEGGFTLTLKKTAYWLVEDNNRLVPIT